MKIAKLAAFALATGIVSTSMINVSEGKVVSRCLTYKSFKRFTNGRWADVWEIASGKKYYIKMRWLKNGKTQIIDSNGKQLKRMGTWRRKGNIIYRYSPTRPGYNRWIFRLRKKC